MIKMQIPLVVHGVAIHLEGLYFEFWRSALSPCYPYGIDQEFEKGR